MMSEPSTQVTSNKDSVIAPACESPSQPFPLVVRGTTKWPMYSSVSPSFLGVYQPIDVYPAALLYLRTLQAGPCPIPCYRG